MPGIGRSALRSRRLLAVRFFGALIAARWLPRSGANDLARRFDDSRRLLRTLRVSEAADKVEADH